MVAGALPRSALLTSSWRQRCAGRWNTACLTIIPSTDLPVDFGTAATTGADDSGGGGDSAGALNSVIGGAVVTRRLD